jgi:hypothetical protein
MEKVDLWTFEGYHKYWFALLKDNTQQRAYELTEEKWHEITGSMKPRYGSLKSFLATRDNYFKKNGRI